MRDIRQAPTDVPAPKKTGTEFEVELITPMYGGGARVGENDPDFPIRPSSVRGQLRFWWRATRGARFDSSEKLFEEEKRIWGSTDARSRVIVKVEPQRRNDDHYRFVRSDPEAYVLFPVKDQKYLVKEGLKFKIDLSYDSSFEKDVLCAVWAWVNFGGIGARTRRGCGALYCGVFAPRGVEHIGDWFKDNVDKYEINLNEMRDWPTLSNRFFVGKLSSAPLEAWKKSIATMKNFRQGQFIGRDKKSDSSKPAGRSRWPEPDTLRSLFPGKYAHSPRDFVPFGFPRAAFGLPIGFKFISGDGPNGTDQKGLRIKPVKSERMASPVILRLLKTENGALPMIALFDSKFPSKIEISGTDFKYSYRDEVKHVKFTNAKYTDSPMKGRTTSGDAVTALLTFACETTSSFREVSI